MSSICNSCGGHKSSCGCGQCQPNKGCGNRCQKKCGCPESILSIEADSQYPTRLRFNLGGRSVVYDFSQVVKEAETCTSIIPDPVNRLLRYNAECQINEITAKELGSIFHLADIGDVDGSTIKDNGILVYRKDAKCGENCEGKNGWISIDPSEEGDTSLEYVMGADSDGSVKSLMPPANSNQTYYLTWDGAKKATWKQPTIVSAPPVNKDNQVTRLYLDENTGEIVAVREDAE